MSFQDTTPSNAVGSILLRNKDNLAYYRHGMQKASHGIPKRILNIVFMKRLLFDQYFDAKDGGYSKYLNMELEKLYFGHTDFQDHELILRNPQDYLFLKEHLLIEKTDTATVCYLLNKGNLDPGIRRNLERANSKLFDRKLNRLTKRILDLNRNRFLVEKSNKLRRTDRVFLLLVRLPKDWVNDVFKKFIISASRSYFKKTGLASTGRFPSHFDIYTLKPFRTNIPTDTKTVIMFTVYLLSIILYRILEG
ncbi:hypothetical protein [Maribacter sp. 2-571]|uniref:hypothetical protein n=1 Tax=Maribacter sp. 2-571 TaxID=3417569 RepID=UPI003D32C89C